MAKRTASGALLSDDSMWWWDGTRWHPATAATTGRPPRAPTSPWPWVVAALLALVLVTALPFWLIWQHAGGVGRGFDRGYAATYLQQRQAALQDLDAKLAALSACERTSGGTCLTQADDLGSAAAAERGTIRTESGLIFFPACLRASAAAEAAALQEVHDGAESLRLVSGGGQDGRAQLTEVSGALQRAGAAVAMHACG